MKKLALLAVFAAFFCCPWNRSAEANTVNPSAWDQPALTSPVTIHLDDQHRNLALSQTQDYILDCPTDPVQATWGLVVWGGHNIVFQNCNYSNSSTSGAAQFKNQTGTLWVHDVHFSGGQQTEGIDLQEPGTTTVVLRDVLIDPITGSFSTNHADCVQTWSGPQRLLVDGFVCTSQYQGFFLLPNQQDSTTNETVWDFRHVELNLNPGGYAWTFGTNGPQHVDLNVEDAFAAGPGQPLLYQFGEGGENFQGGTPPNGDFVQATSTGARGVDDIYGTGGLDPFPLPGETP